MMKTRHFFSMALNTSKELDRQVLHILQTCTPYNKCDYVKNAIISYASQRELKDTLRDVLSEYNMTNIQKRDVMKSNAYENSEESSNSPTTKNTISKKAKNFMTSLQSN